MQDGLVKAGGWGVSMDDLQQLQQDAQRAAPAAAAAPSGTALPPYPPVNRRPPITPFLHGMPDDHAKSPPMATQRSRTVRAEVHPDMRPAGEAPSAPARASSSPPASAGRTSSVSRGRSRGHGRRGANDHGNSRSDWRPQRGKGESHAVPAGRRKPRQAGAREGVDSNRHAERPPDSPARHERIHRTGRSDGVNQQSQHSGLKAVHVSPAREADRAVERAAS